MEVENDRHDVDPPLAQQRSSMREYVEDFLSIGDSVSMVAGQLTHLMLQQNEALEFVAFIKNVGNDAFTPQQRWAMYQLYVGIKSLLTASMGALADMDLEMRSIALNEVIRALFKGQIPLDGMDSARFEAEIRGFFGRAAR